jgi:TonB C terminal
VSTLFTALPEPRKLWIRVLKRVHPDLEAVPAPKGPPPDPWKAWAQAQQATPLRSTYQPPLVPQQPPSVNGPEAFAILWAASAVLCLLLYEILAGLRQIVGRATCLLLLALLTAAALWLIAKNSKLSYNHKATSLWAVASAMILIGVCLLSTGRATPLFLSASASTVQAQEVPVEAKDSDRLDLVNAHPPQTKMPPTPPRLARGENPGSQLTAYIEAVKGSVAQKWNLSEVAANTPAGATVYIQFAVRRRGNHEVPTVETSSGSSSLDASCLRAVNRTHSFGHFPETYTGDSLTVLYHCTYPGSAGINFAQDSILPLVQQPTPDVPVDGAPVVQPPTSNIVIK